MTDKFMPFLSTSLHQNEKACGDWPDYQWLQDLVWTAELLKDRLSNGQCLPWAWGFNKNSSQSAFSQGTVFTYSRAYSCLLGNEKL
ncbi:unnamed protein product [Calypogeia fissa]